MNIKKKSPWILGLLYINPEDPRVFLPLPCKLGMALNFGNPRVIPYLCWISGILLLAAFVVPIAIHPLAFTHNPTTPILWLLAWLAALLTVRLNHCFAWSDYRRISSTSYGLLAVSIGLGLQNMILGTLILWWGGRTNWTWAHGLVVGPVCSLAQTFGKLAAIIMLLKVKPAPSRIAQIRHGLFVGLGFTIYEVAIVFFPAAWTQAVLSHISIWERVSVSVFHIYSAGLLALALWAKRYRLILLVVALHSVMDWLAVATRSLQLPFETVEIIFSLLALITWGAFLISARPVHSGNPHDSGVQQPVSLNTDQSSFTIRH
ncbi:MAG TPA: hypothetical protein PLB62_12610 [Candidatus Sumerlaeota bacterium]|nr:hypothetical protein [Candidatus Sumerlaeota bacterium]